MFEPRGIRNNNAGNIRLGDKWQGLSDIQDDPSFCKFITAEYGIRALAKILLRYQDAYKLDTVRKIINRYAPSTENDTESYIKSVANTLGVKPDDVIDIHEKSTMLVFVRAIIRHENGVQPYDTNTLLKGIEMAGVK